MEGMPVYLRYISYVLPQTYAIQSLRNIFARGWGTDKPEVYLAVVTNFGWIIALLALSLIYIVKILIQLSSQNLQSLNMIDGKID